MFLQIMDYRTADREGMAQLEESWRSETATHRTAQRVVVARDRADPQHYLVLAFFADEEAAKAQFDLAETAHAADRQSSLLIGTPSFVDLDVIKDVTY